MRRIKAVFLALALAVTGCFGTALANEDIMPLASPTLHSHLITLKPWTHKGEIKLGYAISPVDTADAVGISSVDFYRESGHWAGGALGTTANGLVGSGLSHVGDYYFTGTSGERYYAVVTIFATIDNVTDSKTFVTDTVTAP